RSYSRSLPAPRCPAVRSASRPRSAGWSRIRSLSERSNSSPPPGKEARRGGIDVRCPLSQPLPLAGKRRLSRAPPAMIPLLLAAPLLVYMLVFYALPVLAMLLRSFGEQEWTLAHYAGLADDLVFLKTFWNTLSTAAIVTLGTLLLGYPVALALVRARGVTAA